MIAHIVFFKFKSKNKEENIDKVTHLLEELPFKISEILSMEVGVDFSKGERSMDLALYSIFEDDEMLERYRNHPDHLEVVKVIKEVTLETRVVDYLRHD
jgi:mannitol/fructose-specific phosphotransferase system IIA component (Ntr-type)